MKIQVNNLLPNTTYNNYSLGIFTTGGTQVAKVQNANGTYYLLSDIVVHFLSQQTA